MNQDKMRAEFEEFCKSINISYQMSHGQYHSEKTSTYWWIWKSSRESLALEFPDLNSQFISTTMKNKIINSIESQGIKVITK